MATYKEIENIIGIERQDIAEAVNQYLEENWEKYFKSRYLMKCFKGEIMNIIFENNT